MAREMKMSTLQRFCFLRFDYLAPEHEAAIVASQSGLDLQRSADIVAFGLRTRRLQGHGLDEGASTRALIHAASLVVQGLAIKPACSMAIVDTLSDEPGIHQALVAALEAAFQ